MYIHFYAFIHDCVLFNGLTPVYEGPLYITMAGALCCAVMIDLMVKRHYTKSHSVKGSRGPLCRRHKRSLWEKQYLHNLIIAQLPNQSYYFLT